MRSHPAVHPERWQQIEHLYQAALEHRVEERGKFLAEACEGDAELRRELESLLAQDVAGTGPVRQRAVGAGNEPLGLKEYKQ